MRNSPSGSQAGLNSDWREAVLRAVVEPRVAWRMEDGCDKEREHGGDVGPKENSGVAKAAWLDGQWLMTADASAGM